MVANKQVIPITENIAVNNILYTLPVNRGVYANNRGIIYSPLPSFQPIILVLVGLPPAIPAAANPAIAIGGDKFESWDSQNDIR